MRGFPDKLKKEYLAVALLVGILCLILAIPVKKETINETNTAIEEKSEDLKEGAWQEQIQARLQNMLNESEGAGETKVFLTFENSWENCEYCEETYKEWDTGYTEYGCSLFGGECVECCPLSFKYKVED